MPGETRGTAPVAGGPSVVDADGRRAILEAYFSLDPGVIDDLVEELPAASLAGGEWLFREGDAGDALYFLVRGRLEVWIGQGDASRCVGEIVPGESAGELGLLTGEARSGGLRAIRDSLLLRMDRDVFERLAASHPSLALKLAGLVARRLQQRTGGDVHARALRNVAVLPLHDTERVRSFGAELAAAMASHGEVAHLTSDRLEALDAPFAEARPTAEMTAWLGQLESRHRFLVLESGPEADGWTLQALRQADAVLLVADAGRPPDPVAIEEVLDRPESASYARRILVLLHPAGRETLPGTAAWLDAREVSEHLHVRAGNGEDLRRLARLVAGRSVGLVLGGGGARGFAHIGAYRALKEAGIPIDRVGGTSIGAVFAAAVAHEWDPVDMEKKAREAFLTGRPFSDLTLPVVSVLRGSRMTRWVRTLLEGDIEDLPLPFFCVSTNLGRAELDVHRRGSLWRTIRASTAIPGIFPPAVIDRHLAVDGAILNNLPVDVMREQPIGTVIAVDLAAPKEYTLDYEEVPSPWRVLLGRWLPFAKRYRVPGITTLILKAQEVGSLVHARGARMSADLVLNPPVGQFSLTDVDDFDRIVAAGYEYTIQEIERWRSRQAGP